MFSREKKSLRCFLRFVGHANELTVRRQPGVLQHLRDAVGIQPEGVEVHVMAVHVTDMAGFVAGLEGEKQIPARAHSRCLRLSGLRWPDPNIRARLSN